MSSQYFALLIPISVFFALTKLQIIKYLSYLLWELNNCNFQKLCNFIILAYLIKIGPSLQNKDTFPTEKSCFYMLKRVLNIPSPGLVYFYQGKSYQPTVTKFYFRKKIKLVRIYLALNY